MFRAINSGDLSHQVRIEYKAQSQSASGQLVPTWTLLALVWADIQPLSGRELLLAEQTMSKVEARAVVRFRTDITANMRLVYGSIIYNIAAVIQDPRFKDHLTLSLSTGLNAG